MTALEEISTDELMREIQRRLECQNKPDKRLILIGPPGCGKVRVFDRQLSKTSKSALRDTRLTTRLDAEQGTQSPKIKTDHCLCHLATGDMLRAAVAAKTPNGVKAKQAMESGALVSDDIVVGCVGALAGAMAR
jgi:adenylate kinase